MMEQMKKTPPWRYAIGMFGTSIPVNMFKTYAAFFYVDKMGLPTTSFAFVIFIYTFLDAIDNPVYGFLSDRTRSKWGRRRPWLVIGAPALALMFIAFFNPPNIPNLLVYFLPVYVLTGTLDSLINTNYGALFPDLFRTDGERATTNAMRQAFQLVAMVISIALTPVVTDAIGYPLTALIYGILGACVIIFSTIGCHETKEFAESEKPQFWSSISSLVRNSKFWISGLTNAFYSAAMSLVMASMTFYAQYALKIGSLETTALFGTVLVVAIGAVWLWARFIKKSETVKVWRWALLALCVAFIPLYFANSLVTAILASVVLAFGYGGVLATMDLIGARIIDEDAAKSGVRREAIYTSVGGFLNRLNGLFTSLAFTLVFVIYGYESGDNPGPSPDSASKFLLSVFPFVLMVLSCVCSRFLKFKDEPRQSRIDTKNMPNRFENRH